MFLKFFQLYVKQILRSPTWQKERKLNWISAFLILFLLLYCVLLGGLIAHFLEENYPLTNPSIAIGYYIFYYWIVDLMLRYFFQDTPVLTTSALQILPFKKESLAFYGINTLWFTVFNLYPVLLLGPFTIGVQIPNIGLMQAIIWFFSVLLLLNSNSILVYLLRNVVNRFALLGVILLVGLSVFLIFLSKGIIDFHFISDAVFSNSPYIILIFSLFYFGIIYFAGYTYWLSQSKFLKEETSSKKRRSLQIFSGNSLYTQLLNIEIKLLLRNKRPRHVLIMSSVAIIYGVTRQILPYYQGKEMELIISSTFITSMFAMNYFQFFLGWEGVYFDRILTLPIPKLTYVQVKWSLALLFNTVIFMLVLPLAFRDLDVLWANIGLYCFCNGVTIPVLMFTVPLYQKQIALTQKSSFNFQGVSGIHFLLIIPLFILPILLLYVFLTWFSTEVSFLLLAVPGCIGFALRKKILDQIVKKLDKHHYRIAQNLRTQA